MGFCGLALSIIGSTSGESLFDGVCSAAILTLFGLLASFQNRPQLIGRIGYYFGLIAALVFGLNFARLGCKWFEPANWMALATPIALIMGGSSLFSFYKICRARREYVGASLAIGVAISCVFLSSVWNNGQGLIAIDSSYSVALFLVLVGAVVWRFQNAIVVFFRENLSEKLELAPLVFVAVVAVAGAIKLTAIVLPQGALAALQEVIWPTDESADPAKQSEMQAMPNDESLPEPVVSMNPDAP